MKTIVAIMLRREYLGFLLGCLSITLAYEMQNSHGIPMYIREWFAIIMCVIVFICFPLVRRYGK